MKICVAGLWHLGSVTAACLADAGHDVHGFDHHERVIADLRLGNAPISEPGLDALLTKGIGAGCLQFQTKAEIALTGTQLLWVCYDTPVDDEDRADVAWVETEVQKLLPHVDDGTVILLSSQLPIGSTARLQSHAAQNFPEKTLHFACSPENLRLGSAIAAFKDASRIIIGVDNPDARALLEPLVESIAVPAVWMSIKSAEMVKHTINSFLATSVTFINEIATLCEHYGADAFEVEAGIRSEPRIGPRAYVTPGGAFAGGTLARDVSFLTTLAQEAAINVPLLSGILPSNASHREWAFRRVLDAVGGGEPIRLAGLKIGVLGLTYKPGTDTLRRSSSIETCRKLSAAGAQVCAFDPVIHHVPDDLDFPLVLADSAQNALRNADAMVVATEWPEFRLIDMGAAIASMRRPLVIDQNGFLRKALEGRPDITYLRVGSPL